MDDGLWQRTHWTPEQLEERRLVAAGLLRQAGLTQAMDLNRGGTPERGSLSETLGVCLPCLLFAQEQVAGLLQELAAAGPRPRRSTTTAYGCNEATEPVARTLLQVERMLLRIGCTAPGGTRRTSCLRRGEGWSTIRPRAGRNPWKRTSFGH
jgi:hypothetical protein